MNTLLDVQAGEDMIDILLGKKVDESQDDEIVIQQPSVKVSLICPILFTKIKMPVKGKKCKHVEVSNNIKIITLSLNIYLFYLLVL